MVRCNILWQSAVKKYSTIQISNAHYLIKYARTTEVRCKGAHRSFRAFCSAAMRASSFCFSVSSCSFSCLVFAMLDFCSASRRVTLIWLIFFRCSHIAGRRSFNFSDTLCSLAGTFVSSKFSPVRSGTVSDEFFHIFSDEGNFFHADFEVCSSLNPFAQRIHSCHNTTNTF